MWWHPQQDFLSLFHRTPNSSNYFYPVDGLRAIASLLIILCHLVTIFTTFLPSYPHSEWDEFLKSLAFTLFPLMAYGLEIFFMLSGFLLTYKLLSQWNNTNVNFWLFLRQYSILLITRVYRFWPGMLLSILLMLTLGEPRYPNSSYLLESLRHISVWMFFQNYIDIEYWLASLAPLWSISLDMQVHLILPVLLYLFYSCRRHISIHRSLAVLFVLSIILSIIIFDPVTMPITIITRQCHNLPLLLPTHYFVWLQMTYNLTFPFQISQSNPMKVFLHSMYLPLEARFGSFVTGAILATHFVYSSPQSDRHGTIKNFAFVALVFLYIVSSIVVDIDRVPDQFNFILSLAIASSRQIFALGQAFLLFTTLCPSTHPYHLLWLKRFLSLPIWIPISKLSYSVYVIHWRISFELIFGGPLMFLRTYPITYAIFISLPVVLLISQVISCIWYVFIEKPIARALARFLKHSKLFKLHLT